MHKVQQFAASVLFASTLGLASCKDKPKTDVADAQPAPAAPIAHRGDDSTAALDLVDDLSRCEIDHGDVLIDLGSPATHEVTNSYTLAADASLVDTERDGETWMKTLSRSLTM